MGGGDAMVYAKPKPRRAPVAATPLPKPMFGSAAEDKMEIGAPSMSRGEAALAWHMRDSWRRQTRAEVVVSEGYNMTV